MSKDDMKELKCYHCVKLTYVAIGEGPDGKTTGQRAREMGWKRMRGYVKGEQVWMCPGCTK